MAGGRHRPVRSLYQAGEEAEGSNARRRRNPRSRRPPGTSPGVGGGGVGGGGGFVDAPRGRRGGGALRRAGGVGGRHGFLFLCSEGVPARSREPPCFSASSPPPSDSP